MQYPTSPAGHNHKTNSRNGVCCKKRASSTCHFHLKDEVISILYFNAISIRNKLWELKILLDTNTYDLIFISESWLKENDMDSDVVNSNYCIIRMDRKSHAGGVAVIYKATLADRVVTYSVDESKMIGFELLMFDLYLTRRCNLTFVCVYLPPQSSTNLYTVTSFLTYLKSIITDRREVYIIGDFNFSQYSTNKIV